MPSQTDADAMFLEIITPEKKVFSGEVTSVHLPGTMGRFQVLKNHAPVISTLVKGDVRFSNESGTTAVSISGGVAEVRENRITVLAGAA